MFWTGAAQASTSIVTGGFNEDEVLAAPSGSITRAVDANYAAWAENGYMASNGTVTAGLPVSGSFISATGDGITYRFQPYIADNALRMGNGDPSFGTMMVVPGKYSTLYILDTSGSTFGVLSSNITLNFASGPSSTYASALFAPDWYHTYTSSQVALGGLQRIVLSNNSINGDGAIDFQLYESVLNLTSADLGRTLVSVTFNNVAGSGATSVYDIEVVPLPPTVLLLGSGLLGLGGLRFWRKRS
jgi:hypothetical protein